MLTNEYRYSTTVINRKAIYGNALISGIKYLSKLANLFLFTAISFSIIMTFLKYEKKLLIHIFWSSCFFRCINHLEWRMQKFIINAAHFCMPNIMSAVVMTAIDKSIFLSQSIKEVQNEDTFLQSTKKCGILFTTSHFLHILLTVLSKFET